MKKNTLKNLFYLSLVILLGCTSTRCKNAKHKEEISKKMKHGDQLKKTFKLNDKLSANNNEHVFVYKYDGALQCGLGHGIKVHIMEKQLKDIPVFSRENKPDGLMHVQACGQPTGRANVYEIKKSDLEKAKSLGFMLWKFQ